MKAVLVIPPKGFKDESVSKVSLLLKKWGIDVVISSYAKAPCMGEHGASYLSDLNTARVSPENFDAIVLIDGKGVDAYRLYEFAPMLDLIKKFNSKKKIIFGIGNAVKIMAKAGIINKRKIAESDDEVIKNMAKAERAVMSEEPAIADENIITSKNNDSLIAATSLMFYRMGLK